MAFRLSMPEGRRTGSARRSDSCDGYRIGRTFVRACASISVRRRGWPAPSWPPQCGRREVGFR